MKPRSRSKQFNPNPREREATKEGSHGSPRFKSPRGASDRRLRFLTRDVARIVIEARENLRSAIACLDRGGVNSAAWRVADALGLLAKVEPDAPGIGHLTGRGFRLAQREDEASR